jgi:hypothetical protein
MDEICVVTPVLAGRADAAREFLGRLDGDSRADYQRSEQRLGISKEVWFLASGPRDVSLVAYIEAAGFAHSLQAFAASRDAFTSGSNTSSCTSRASISTSRAR